MTYKTLPLNDVNYHVLDEGRGERTALLLHGMPDTSKVWKHQIEALRRAGYRVVAPDMLGYGGTDRPEDTQRYRGQMILADMVALLDALELEKVDVLGHDWGAYASWELVLNWPERFRRHIAFSVGHPDAMLTSTTPHEVKESWYMYLNTQADTGPLYLANEGAFFKKVFIPTHPELDEVWSRLKDARAMSAMLNWDKANPMASLYLATATAPAGPRPCGVPTLGLWSSGDKYLWEAQMLASESLMEAPWRYECVERASHWLMLDEPARVNELMLTWLNTD